VPAACLAVQFSAARQLRFWLLIAFLFFPREKKRSGGDAVQIGSSSIHQPWLAFGRSLWWFQVTKCIAIIYVFSFTEAQVCGMRSRPNNQFLVSSVTELIFLF